MYPIIHPSNSSTLATSCEELTHWKRLWCWKGLKAGGEGDDRGWDGWMASRTRCTWVWVNSGSWWWTERPGVLWFMGSQRVGHDWATEMNWTELNLEKLILLLASKNHSNINAKTFIGRSWVGKFFLLFSTCIHSFLLSVIDLVYCAHFEHLLRKKDENSQKKSLLTCSYY